MDNTYTKDAAFFIRNSRFLRPIVLIVLIGLAILRGHQNQAFFIIAPIALFISLGVTFLAYRKTSWGDTVRISDRIELIKDGNVTLKLNREDIVKFHKGNRTAAIAYKKDGKSDMVAFDRRDFTSATWEALSTNLAEFGS